MGSKFRDKFAIVGAGITPTARTHSPDPNISGLMLEAWAVKLAIADAGLTRKDIDGSVHAMMASPHPPAQWLDTYSRTLGLKPNFYMTVARGGQAAHNGIILATQMLELGLANYVIVSCGLPAWSAAHNTNPNKRSKFGVSLEGSLDMGLTQMGSAAARVSANHSMFASRHMHEYGTTFEQLGAVAVSARQWAQLNPDARFHGRPLTIEEYLDAPIMTSPLRKFDCCLQSDLGVAFVLTTADRAREAKQKPVYIKGVGQGDHAREFWWDKSNYTRVDAAFTSKHAFDQAGITLKDIDVAQLYDCFTMEMIFYMEDYGWCEKGEGGAFVASGAIAPGGLIPMNTYGGLLAGGYLFDFPCVYEAVIQLRGQAGARQVEDAKIALTNGHGGEMLLPGMCSAHATMVLGGELS